ncbi:MAG TPA: YciI family protein [Polyangiales bacterium]|nr:YciI family protein [Polyangiales bacterium]
MKFILMMNGATKDWAFFRWTAEEREAHMAHMHRLNADLREAGELVTVEALAQPAQARLVRAGKNNEPVVTDGPFPETKEFLAGYWIVDVEDAKRAYAIAARASAAPGERGVPVQIPIEVREVMSI